MARNIPAGGRTRGTHPRQPPAAQHPVGAALRRGRLLSFRTRDWTAVVRLDGSLAAVRIPMLESAAANDLAAGDKVAVLLFHEGDQDDGVLLGAFGNVGGGAADILTDSNGDVLSDSNGDVLFG